MPSYLVTIQYEAKDAEEAADLAHYAADQLNDDRGAVVVAVQPKFQGKLPESFSGVTTTKHHSDQAVAVVRALSPAVVEELRQMWRADARDEARAMVREHEEAEARFYRCLR
jgi:hypothetical protein